MRAMGRFSRLRAPAVGWPVAPPPPVERPASAPPTGGGDVASRDAGRNGSAPGRDPAHNGTPADAGRTGSPPTAASTPTPPTPPAPTPASEPTAELPGPLGGGAVGFRDRARVRRRLRYLRQVRELAFRDLGGFVFDSRRFDRPREDIVDAKVKGILAMDRELRTLETALDDRQELLLLHEPGITACPRCGVIHGSDANFCPGCGLSCGGGGPLPLDSRAPLPARPGPGDQPTLTRPTLSGE
jgi:hypothetical protein